MIIYKRDYFIFTGVMFVIVLYIVNISVQIMYQGDGIKVAQIKKEIAELQLQNDILQNQIYDQSSLRTIEAKAKAMGFRRVTPADYIVLKGGGE